MDETAYRKDIDHALFEPLARFFMEGHKPSDLLRFSSFVAQNCHPDYRHYENPSEGEKAAELGQYQGFAFRAYVKWSLDRFSRSGHSLKQVLFSAKRTEDKKFMMDSWGNVIIYPAGNARANTIRIDCLYEFDGNEVTPVIFDIHGRGAGGGRKSAEKMELIWYLYHSWRLHYSPPYFCEVRPAKSGEQFGCYIRNTHADQRKLIAPYWPETDKLAHHLWEIDGKKLRPRHQKKS